MARLAAPRFAASTRRAAVALAASGALAVGAVGVGVPAQASTAALPQAVTVMAKATTVSTGLTWADGKPIRATVVKEKGAGKITRDSLGKRTLASTAGASVVGVLADGRALVFKKGKLSVVERSGKIRPYAKGKTPTHDPGLTKVLVQGNAVYLSEYSEPRGVSTWTVTAYKGSARAVSGKTVFKKDGPGSGMTEAWTVNKGRVYFTKQTWTKDDQLASTHVYSRALGGTKDRLEAKNADAPVLTDAGVVVTTVVRDVDGGYGYRYTGARVIGGPALVKAVGKDWNFSEGGGGGNAAAVEGGGRVLTLNANGDDTFRANYLVVDYKAKKAWKIITHGLWWAAPSGSGTRATWMGVRADDPRAIGTKVYSFDVTTGKLRVATTKNQLTGVAGNGKALAWSTGTGVRASLAAGILR